MGNLLLRVCHPGLTLLKSLIQITFLSRYESILQAKVKFERGN